MHVIGGGLAGLASAVELAQSGHQVSVYEMAGHAGGRCRSFFDETLGRPIDNGNHLLMSANHAVRDYLRAIGSHGRFWSPPAAAYPFLDLKTMERWTLALNKGAFPWWVFKPDARVAGSRPLHYLSGMRLPFAGAERTVDDCLNRSNPLYERFWEPLTVAALNTHPSEASAKLLWRVLSETFAKGGAGCIPMIAREGLGPALIEPALATLKNLGAKVHFNARLLEFKFDDPDGGRATGLIFSERGDLGAIAVAPGDKIIVALPPLPAAALLPGLIVPTQSRAIVNAHFRVARSLTVGDHVDFLGLIGGDADWLFMRGDIVSVTVSAADAIADWTNETAQAALWSDTSAALGLRDDELVAARIIKEKRATFAQTPEQNALRPGPVTKWSNIVLAGDWTDTGLPASIEGTVRSARAAVRALRSETNTGMETNMEKV